MKVNNLKTIIISVITSIIIFMGIITFIYFNAPIFKAENLKEAMLGASITELDGTDTMSDFPTTYNANLNSLNDNKMEMATSSVDSITTLSNLVTTGTIGTGTWNADVIGVGYGGTGTTTPTAKQIMFGNGASGLQVIGFGTNGQFLTSGGDATLPSWTTSSIDESADYDWTGNNTGVGIVGEIIAYASSTIPVGWLAADGSAVSTSTYSNLFDIIGYTYGGSGATFNLPDLSGRNVIGYGSATSTIDTMGETGGEDEHLLSSAESGVPAHTHGVGVNSGYGGVPAGIAGSNNSGSTHTFNSNANTAADASSAHNVLDPYIVLQYIIKY